MHVWTYQNKHMGNQKQMEARLAPTTAPTDAAVSKERAAHVLAESLIAKIRDGRIGEGDPLPTERELADRYDASRPTVREALAEMQHRGYLIAGGGRRPRAQRPSIETIVAGAAGHIREILGDAETGAHLEQMRQFIEMGAVREAALKADSVQLSRIATALEANGRSIGAPEFVATDIEFHRALVSVVGNPIILRLHDMFVSSLLATRAPRADPAQHDATSHKEHRAIYEAVIAGDPTGATELMDRHLSRSYRARLALKHQPET